MKNISLKISHNWYYIVATTVASLMLLFVYTYDLSSVGPPDTQAEQLIMTSIDSRRDILETVVFAPHKAIGLVIVKLQVANTASLRLVSVATTCLAVILFFLVLKQWFSLRVATLTTVLFATSSWVLFQARWMDPESMLLLVIPVALLTASLLKEKKYDFLIPITSCIAVLCLYIPGVWIMFLSGIILLQGNIRLAWRRFGSTQKVAWVTSIVIPAIPLIFGLMKIDNLRTWLGRPLGGFSTKSMIDNVVWLPNQLLGSGLSDGLRWLPGTPVIDVATFGLALTGIIFVIRDNRFPIRRLALLILATLCLLLITLFGANYISLLLPLVYMFVACGITFLLEQWFHVFPKNPLARNFGLLMLSLLVGLICIYQVARYHYVWPRAEETVHLFKG